MSQEPVSQVHSFIQCSLRAKHSDLLTLTPEAVRPPTPVAVHLNCFASAAHRLTLSKVMVQVLLAFDWMAVRNRLILIKKKRMCWYKGNIRSYFKKICHTGEYLNYLVGYV